MQHHTSIMQSTLHAEKEKTKIVATGGLNSLNFVHSIFIQATTLSVYICYYHQLFLRKPWKKFNVYSSY